MANCLLCVRELREDEEVIVLEEGDFAESYPRGNGDIAPAGHYPCGERGFVHNSCWNNKFKKTSLHPDKWITTK